MSAGVIASHEVLGGGAAITYLGGLGAVNHKLSGVTSIDITNTSGAAIPAGTLLVLAWTSDSTPTWSPTDSGGAAWTVRASINSGGTGGITHRVFTCKTVTAISAGAVITTVSGGDTVAKAGVIVGLSGTANTLRGTVGTGTSTGGTQTATTTGTLPVTGDVVIGTVGNEFTSMTTDTDTTNGTWSTPYFTTTSGGSGATNSSAGIQVKIVTGNGSQTFNPGVGANDGTATCFALVPA